MAKKKIDSEIFKTLIEDYNIKDTNDIKDMLKDLLSGTIQTMLEAEIEHELGYAKHSMKDKTTSNARNGHSKKTVRSEYGNIDLYIPRDRNAEFEPQIIPKYQREITGIEGQILFLYAKGMSNRDIEDHLNNLYGIDVSPSMISKITDKIIPEIREWHSLVPLYSPDKLWSLYFFSSFSSFSNISITLNNLSRSFPCFFANFKSFLNCPVNLTLYAKCLSQLLYVIVTFDTVIICYSSSFLNGLKRYITRFV